MNTLTCINNRRSIRRYEDRPIIKEDLDMLLELATKAATGSGMEPWGFVVLDNKEEIDKLSEDIKANLDANLDKYPYLEQYKKWFTNPKFHVFNKANTVILVYGNKESHWYVYDCTLAAANITLAGYDMGIGSCWIGFAEAYCNTSEFKKKYNVPENFELVAPLSVGYINESLSTPKRKKPIVFNSNK